MTITQQTIKLQNRIYHTLLLAEERGYNLTLQQLSRKCIGGQIPVSELDDILKNFHDVESDGTFIATRGNLYSEKCRRRQIAYATLQPKYTKIAMEFVEQYRRVCPWVYCILLSGSMASEGLDNGEDIDFDIIVHDGFRYTSYFLALLLCLKYSLKYGKHFWKHYVICISVIWEKRHVLPVQRQDGQVAFELLNAKVVYNQDFFNDILIQNTWLKNYFPQLYQHTEKNNNQTMISMKSKNKMLSWLIEMLSKGITFILVKIGMLLIDKDHEIRKRITVKRPYTFFDVPEKI